MNRRQVDRVASVVRMHATPQQHRIGVLGLSYKPDTPVIEESQGVMLANRLAAEGFTTTVFDPAALTEAQRSLAPSISRASSLAECVEQCDVVVVMVPWPQFREIPSLLRARARKPPIVIDCWRLLGAHDLRGGARPVYLGKSRAKTPSRELASIRA